MTTEALKRIAERLQKTEADHVMEIFPDEKESLLSLLSLGYSQDEKNKVRMAVATSLRAIALQWHKRAGNVFTGEEVAKGLLYAADGLEAAIKPTIIKPS